MIILFGSVARRRYGKGSDIDILLVTRNINKKELNSLEKNIGLISLDISSIYGITLNPILIKLDDFKEGIKKKKEFYVHLWKDRIIFYGRESFLRKIAQGGVPVD